MLLSVIEVSGCLCLFPFIRVYGGMKLAFRLFCAHTLHNCSSMFSDEVSHYVFTDSCVLTALLAIYDSSHSALPLFLILSCPKVIFEPWLGGNGISKWVLVFYECLFILCTLFIPSCQKRGSRSIMINASNFIVAHLIFPGLTSFRNISPKYKLPKEGH